MGAEMMKRFTCDYCRATAETRESEYCPSNWANMRIQTHGRIDSSRVSGLVFHKNVWACSRACLIASLNRIASDLEKPKRGRRKATVKKKKKKRTTR